MKLKPERTLAAVIVRLHAFEGAFAGFTIEFKGKTKRYSYRTRDIFQIKDEVQEFLGDEEDAWGVYNEKN